MKKAPASTSSASQLLPILLAFATMAAFSLLLPGGNETKTAKPQTIVNIGVEHREPLQLSFSVSQGKTPGLLRISRDGSETVLLSLPAAWDLLEVLHVTLSDVPSDPPTFGFRRWHVPAGAVLTFSLPAPPDGAVVLNPTKVPLSLHVKKIDLVAQTSDSDVFLTTDQPQRIW